VTYVASKFYRGFTSAVFLPLALIALCSRKPRVSVDAKTSVYVTTLLSSLTHTWCCLCAQHRFQVAIGSQLRNGDSRISLLRGSRWPLPTSSDKLLQLLGGRTVD
jgi:hypothetical protein